MLIVGTGGLGREVFGILYTEMYRNEIVFFDENPKAPSVLYQRYRVIKRYEELSEHFAVGSRAFVTAIGHPRLREKVNNRIIAAGGEAENVISQYASVFPFLKEFSGCIIQPGAGISHGAELGFGCAIHINATIGHSVKMGNYVNVSPGASVIGPCSIGEYSYISAQAIVMPGITIGRNAIIGVGAIADRDVADFETVERD